MKDFPGRGYHTGSHGDVKVYDMFRECPDGFYTGAEEA